MKLVIDFESRSLVDLRKTTTSRYAEDPSTEVLCLAIKVDDHPPEYWCPDFVWDKLPPDFQAQGKLILSEVLDLVVRAESISAHNASFERLIWNHIMVKRYGCPEIPISKWRCTAAVAAMHSLPRSLDQATSVLGLAQLKDKAGHALMMKMCKPLPPLQKHYVLLSETLGISLVEAKERFCSDALKERNYSGEHDHLAIRWHETPEAFENLIRYCIQDVEAEYALSKRLSPLPPYEQKVWELDQTINQRGFEVDLDACHAFIEMTQECQIKADEQFSLATGGAVASPKCYVGFAEWIRSQGVNCDGVGADAVEELLLRQDLPDCVREALEVAQMANKSSIAKYEAFVRGTCADGRMRDTMLYHGASTGRAAGRLVQPQNLPRGEFQDVDECIATVLRRDFDTVSLLWGSPMSAASTCIRGMIKASEGKSLTAADFNAIEGRVLAWLAEEESELEAYRDGKCPYCATASKCFNMPYEEILAGYKSGDEAMTHLRFLGKTGTLAAGFSGGQAAVARFAPDMEKQERVDLIKRWREAHPKTKEFWYALTDAAAGAVRNPNKVFSAGKYISFLYRKEYGFLMMKLPSGRKLYYAFPECHKEWIGPNVMARKAKVHPGTHWRFSDLDIWADKDGTVFIKPDGEEEREATEKDLWEKEAYRVQAWTVDGVTKKWEKRDLGITVVCENAVQATARDLLVNALFNLEEAGYRVVLHIHDEVISETVEGSVEDFERVMTRLPDWAKGLPIKAKGWTGKRFKK